jgi:hypothetical protein
MIHAQYRTRFQSTQLFQFQLSSYRNEFLAPRFLPSWLVRSAGRNELARLLRPAYSPRKADNVSLTWLTMYIEPKTRR